MPLSPIPYEQIAFKQNRALNTLVAIGKGAIFIANITAESALIIKNGNRLIDNKSEPAVDFVHGPADL